jgi:hypothetical protein
MTIGKVAAGIAAWINSTCLSASELVPHAASAKMLQGSINMRSGTAKLKIRNA